MDEISNIEFEQLPTLIKNLERGYSNLIKIISRFPVGIVIFDLHFRIKFINQNLMEVLNLMNNNTTTLRMENIFGSDYSFEKINDLFNGKLDELSFNTRLDCNDDDKLAHVTISEIGQTEAGLKLALAIFQFNGEQDKRLNEIKLALTEQHQITNVGTFKINIANHSMYWSEETFRIFSILPIEKETSIETFYHFVHPEDLEHFISCLERTIDNVCQLNIEFRIIDGLGNLKHLHCIGDPVSDSNGNIEGIFGIMLDYTEKKQLEGEKDSLITQLLSTKVSSEQQYAELQSLYEKLSETKNILQETIASKDKFFNILAHDLRGTILRISGTY
ncbi:MAG: hypothetical protein HW421_986 [Ignavibacteria bacterium]|nr:hypothetical protein [Ignavibacteria bacterium]